MASAASLGHRIGRYVLPPVGAACIGYGALQAFEATRSPGEPGVLQRLGLSGDSGEAAALRAQWLKDSADMDARRLEWVRKAAVAAASSPAAGRASTDQDRLVVFSATVIQEVHKMEALGAAGIRLQRGDTVNVIAVGTGREEGFHVVTDPAGKSGIYPKAYLQQKPDGA
eukprot:TRINITY_DN121950_c0_g1_i1.p2 TRINITY_DN121950_c0_g1~~TRINITY_DN121950_c0_g1_i1.p2  ORF type:complete len:170 (-),score=39.49 TRINITY_DN121950_c0_g1_i1:26-535(-)